LVWSWLTLRYQQYRPELARYYPTQLKDWRHHKPARHWARSMKQLKGLKKDWSDSSILKNFVLRNSIQKNK